MINKITALLALFVIATVGMGVVIPSNRAMAASCTPTRGFFGLPTWYKHLDGQTVQEEATDTQTCQPILKDINDIWKIVAAILEILLRLASLISIGFIVYGGVGYILSQGSPDKTKQSLSTIINALVGLVITVAAAAIVGFIAGKF